MSKTRTIGRAKQEKCQSYSEPFKSKFLNICKIEKKYIYDNMFKKILCFTNLNATLNLIL